MRGSPEDPWRFSPIGRPGKPHMYTCVDELTLQRPFQEILGGHFRGVRDYLRVFVNHFGRTTGVKSAEKIPTELVNETIQHIS